MHGSSQSERYRRHRERQTASRRGIERRSVRIIARSAQPGSGHRSVARSSRPALPEGSNVDPLHPSWSGRQAIPGWPIGLTGSPRDSGTGFAFPGNSGDLQTNPEMLRSLLQQQGPGVQPSAPWNAPIRHADAKSFTRPAPNQQPPAPTSGYNTAGGIVTGNAQTGPGANPNQNLNAQGQPVTGQGLGQGGGGNASNPFNQLGNALRGISKRPRRATRRRSRS